MESFIRLERVPYEEPHHLNLVIQVSNGRQQGELEFYDNALTLLEIAEALESFPRDISDSFLWQLGSEQPSDNFAHYFYFMVHCYKKTGQSAIYIRFNNNRDLPDREISEFCIKTYPADINRLGALFREFSKLETKVLEWSATSAEFF